MPTKKYKVNGKRVPGVTTIISTSLGWGKEGLLHWAWQQGVDGKDFREERDKAANAGTIAHALAEADIKGEPPPERPTSDAPDDVLVAWLKADMAFRAYLSWKEMSKLALESSEISLVSSAMRFGGTIDAVARFGKRLELVDFKTSNHIHPEMLVQLSAYRYLWEVGIPFEMGPPPPSAGTPLAGIHLLRFSKAGDFHHSYWDAERMKSPFRTFQILRELYDLKKELEEMV